MQGKGFGWVLIGLAVLTSCMSYRNWTEGGASRRTLTLTVVLAVVIVAIVVDVRVA